MGDCAGRVPYTKTGLIKFKTLLHAHRCIDSFFALSASIGFVSSSHAG